jgi:hypothetical protein
MKTDAPQYRATIVKVATIENANEAPVCHRNPNSRGARDLSQALLEFLILDW